MTSGSLPVTLRVSGRRVLVVGGGRVATRRARTLVDAGADTIIVAPEVTDAITDMAARGLLTWHQRRYSPADLDDTWLVQTATASATDDRVARDAEQRRIWCLKGGDPEGATVWMPAVLEVEDRTVAVSGGGDARRAVELRDRIAAALNSGSSA